MVTPGYLFEDAFFIEPISILFKWYYFRVIANTSLKTVSFYRLYPQSFNLMIEFTMIYLLYILRCINKL